MVSDFRVSGMLRTSTIVEGGIVLVVLVLLLAFSLFGLGLAQAMLPFWAGGTLGYFIAHLATAAGVPSKVQIPTLIVAALVLVGVGITSAAGFLPNFAGIEVSPWLESLSSSVLNWETPTGQFLCGLLPVVVAELMLRGTLPGIFGDSLAEARAEGKEVLRSAGVFGIAAALVLVPVALLIGFVALIFWLAVHFG